MSLARAKAIGRRAPSNGRLWPMPIRETDLGNIYAEITVRPLAGSTKSWTGTALVDTGATDTFLPAKVLRRLGIQPSALRSYELADGTEQELPIGFGVIEVLGRRWQHVGIRWGQRRASFRRDRTRINWLLA